MRYTLPRMSMPDGAAGGLVSGSIVHLTLCAPAGALKVPGPKYITTWLSPVCGPPPATWPFCTGSVTSPGSGGLLPAARLGGGDTQRYGSGGTTMPSKTGGAARLCSSAAARRPSASATSPARRGGVKPRTRPPNRPACAPPHRAAPFRSARAFHRARGRPRRPAASPQSRSAAGG